MSLLFTNLYLSIINLITGITECMATYINCDAHQHTTQSISIHSIIIHCSLYSCDQYHAFAMRGAGRGDEEYPSKEQINTASKGHTTLLFLFIY